MARARADALRNFYCRLRCCFHAKRNANRSGSRVIASASSAANVLNNFWLVAPMFHPRGIYVHWLDVAEFVALGGFWFASFFYFLKQRPLLPAQLVEVTPHG